MYRSNVSRSTCTWPCGFRCRWTHRWCVIHSWNFIRSQYSYLSIVSGSIATGWQAAFGAGAAGGVFATLQSAAMGGYGVTAVSGVTQAIGAASLIALRQRRSESSSSCSSSESCPCLCHSPQHPEAPPPLSPPTEPSPPTRIDTPPPPYSPEHPTLPSASGRCADSCPCACHRAPAPDSSASLDKH